MLGARAVLYVQQRGDGNFLMIRGEWGGETNAGGDGAVVCVCVGVHKNLESGVGGRGAQVQRHGLANVRQQSRAKGLASVGGTRCAVRAAAQFCDQK